MFGELTREATNLAERTNVLQARIDRLAIKVTQLDSGVEEGKKQSKTSPNSYCFLLSIYTFSPYVLTAMYMSFIYILLLTSLLPVPG